MQDYKAENGGGKERRRQKMIYPEYKREMDRIQMLLPDRCPDENDYQYEMILHNQIQGMIPDKKQFSNGIPHICPQAFCSR